MNHYRIYTGPTIVHQTADRLLNAGVRVVVEGTAHLYVRTNLEPLQVLTLLGPTWKTADVVRLPN
jgi:hypothetical protein